MHTLLTKKPAGLTLIELLVVIAIVAILTAAALPSFTSTTQRFRALGEINAFVGDLQYARSEAIRQGVPVTICASTNGSSCSSANVWQTGWIVASTPAGGGALSILRIQRAWTSTDTFITNDNTTSVTYTHDGFTSGMADPQVTFTVNTTPVVASAAQCVILSSVGRQQKQATGAC